MVDSVADVPRRVAFVSTRISGTDGVSLEIEKWAQVLEGMGHSCHYIAALSDRPPERCALIPEMHFQHPVIAQINQRCFSHQLRGREVSRRIHEMALLINQRLEEALQRFAIDLVIAENCVTLPMNIPLGLALVETIMESGIPCIAHHHDFVWERDRFLVNAVDDLLHAAFPPPLNQIQHVAINTQAAKEFSRRVSLPCRVIPNVMDFAHPPCAPDEYCLSFREAIGIGPEDKLILQPTRVIERKGIEHSIELVRRLGNPRCRLVITHASGDEGDRYAKRIREYAQMLDVGIIDAEPLIAPIRRVGSDGRRRYTIWDVYGAADFVTYPSTYEGFGNAFLEAIYYRKPVLCNRYAIYRTDIEPSDVGPVLMEGFITDDVVAQTLRVLEDADYRQTMVDHNYRAAAEFFSYGRVESELRAILCKPRFFTRATMG
jgi:glycosyltransferase involved in cell wall biosynthesis